jgi:hypothetical protein
MDALALFDGLADWLALGETEALGDTLMLALGLLDGDADCEAEGLTLAEGLADMDLLGLADGLLKSKVPLNSIQPGSVAVVSPSVKSVPPVPP